MAIQNFLSGGYYGKLGDTVGQRWHNKRTIRTYVIPANPRTEPQQANRQIFKTATRLAQIAYNSNKGNPEWDTTEKGQFSQMVSLAKLRLQAGMSEADALPLYPDGFTPSITISDMQYSYTSGTRTHRWSENTYQLTQSRSFQAVIIAFNEITNSWDQIVLNKNFTNGQYLDFTWEQDQIHSFPTGATIQANTTDDSTHAGASIEWLPNSFVQTELPYLNIEVTWEPLQPMGPTDFYTNAILPLTNRDIQFNVSIYARINGSSTWTNYTESVVYGPPDELGVISFDNGWTYDYIAGSKINATTDVVTTSSARLAFNIATLPLYPHP